MIDRWIAEATECDFKVALEIKKPKSWLKSVSAFANGIGGTLFFGIDDNRNVVGLTNAQADAEAISRLIKERITPYPNFILAPEQQGGKYILVLSVFAGRSTPYYYKADGITEAYIRIGNESVIAPSYILNQLLLKGMNRTYDALNSNPILADIFGRLGYMERQGSGFKKITESYHAAHNYRDELEPKFYSDASSFQVTLYNLNYGTDEKGSVEEENVTFEQKKVAFEAKKVAFERSISGLKINKPTKDKILCLFENFGYDVPFARADVIELCKLAPSSAGKMLNKIKELGLIVSVAEQGRGKYIFIEAKE